jgi:hypothetical protein
MNSVASDTSLKANLPGGRCAAMALCRRALLSLSLAVVAGTFACPALAQRQPAGIFDWEARAGNAKVRGQYVFEASGRFRMSVLGVEPPPTYSGRWEMRQGNVILHTQDGSVQTYRWDNADLVLVANTAGMPTEPVVLKHRTGSPPSAP